MVFSIKVFIFSLFSFVDHKQYFNNNKSDRLVSLRSQKKAEAFNKKATFFHLLSETYISSSSVFSNSKVLSI